MTMVLGLVLVSLLQTASETTLAGSLRLANFLSNALRSPYLSQMLVVKGQPWANLLESGI